MLKILGLGFSVRGLGDDEVSRETVSCNSGTINGFSKSLQEGGTWEGLGKRTKGGVGGYQPDYKLMRSID